jgi:hypothetical protein
MNHARVQEKTAAAGSGAGFGARLRAQRERQQISLDFIAEATKIRRHLLESLEHDDVSQWPGGLFRRSYLRSYAAAIGLDPEQAVRDFLASHPDQVEEPKTAAEAAATEEARVKRGRGLLQTLFSRFQAGHKSGVPSEVSSLPARDHDDAPSGNSGDRARLRDDAMNARHEAAPGAAAPQPLAAPAQPSLPGLPAPEPSPNLSIEVDLPGMARL